MLTLGRGFRLHASQETSSPRQLGPFQGHLDIHVLTAIVGDDDVEVRVAGDLEQLLHVSDELLHPARLVLHYPRGAGREKEAEVTQRRHAHSWILHDRVSSDLCSGAMQLWETRSNAVQTQRLVHCGALHPAQPPRQGLCEGLRPGLAISLSY